MVAGETTLFLRSASVLPGIATPRTMWMQPSSSPKDGLEDRPHRGFLLSSNLNDRAARSDSPDDSGQGRNCSDCGLPRFKHAE